MYKRQKFVFEYELDKPVCDSCGKDFDEKEVKETESHLYGASGRIAPKHEWHVEEDIYVGGERHQYHTKCLRAALRLTGKPKKE